jgi:diacylglycerol O-acyltransferase / wax synthase
MAHYNYERLTALDNSFLVMEGPNALMHVAATAIFEAAAPATNQGGVDIGRVTDYLASRLHKIPRYRQRLAYIPIEQHPVWIDDTRFNLHYHVRHACLPRPGDERQLKRMVARVKAQEMDRGKPLWELWIIEGLEGGRFALITKTHHCMIDGVSGVDLLSVLLRPTPNPHIEEPPRWIPRPAPAPLELLRDETLARLKAPLGFASRLLRDPASTLADVRDGLAAVGEALGAGLQLGSETPFNQPIGPHRRFDWATTDISAIREIREHLGGSLNDVVLAVVAGAVRRFLERRGVNPADIDFRVFVPVSLRDRNEHGGIGNRVAGWMVDLPIGETDPCKQLARICKTTARLKESKQARGSEILSEVLEWTGPAILSAAMRATTGTTSFNLVVTNVPGPTTPLYLLGARMLEVYPLVPLAPNHGLGIALFSYAGKLHWGFNADWDIIPDLHDFVADVATAFADLSAAARTAPAVKATRKRAVAHGIRPENGAGASA